MKRIVQCLGATVMLSLLGCAEMGSNVRPIIDTKGVNMNKYEQDLQECQSIATQQSGVAPGAAKGAGAGAAIGGLVGLVAGGNKTNIIRDAGVGAVIGSATGAHSGNVSQEQVVKRCLIGRGYKVLN